MESKQSSIEWFYQRILSKDIKSVFEQAKKFEKQKMIEMHDKGFDSVVQLNDDYAIGFAEWLLIIYNEDIIYDAYSKKELLEIYKIENDL